MGFKFSSFKSILFAFSFYLLSSISYAQFTEFHPELTWLTIKGEKVEVHFHEDAERTAKIVAKIADEIWEPITSLYEYEPETVHYVIKDIDDYSNGATYFFDNKIEIWSSALDTDLRGTHNWLRNVISHEFTHLVQIQASLKTTRRLPAIFLQVLNYEDERRPDILYGFPNVIVSYPLAAINIPAWFAEGTAQYMRKEFDYDQWDTHRDMILRSYALDGNMLTWNQMGVFGKTSLGNESVYNSGFALTKYIAQKYGEDALRKISRALGKLSNFTFDAAVKDVLGITGEELYNEWNTYITNDYHKRSEKVLSNLVQGEVIAKEGFGNFYPKYSSDGKKFVYISNKSADYFSLSGIYLYDFETKKEKHIASGVRSTVDWLPQQNKIIYAKLEDDNKYWYNVHDLYVYDLDNEKETRLTHNLRANQPAVSNDGKTIVFVFQIDGTSNLGIVDIEGKNFKQVTLFRNGEQVYNPKFSNDDKHIIFDFSTHHSREIAKINIDGSGFEKVITSEFDVRNSVYDKNGDIIYASDETGIFNLYRYNSETKQSRRLTNVIGGAFMPAVSHEGDILYAGYTSDGYKIFRIKKEEQNKVEQGNHYVWMANPPLDKDNPKGDMIRFDVDRLKFFDDSQTPDYEKTKYGGAFSKLTFFPFLRYDNYNTSNKFGEKLKPGLYVTSSDMLNRYSIFAGASINTRLERDLFLLFEYKNKLPLLFDIGLRPEVALEIYNISREADVDIIFDPLDPSYDVGTDVTYNLFEVDFVAKHRIFSRNQNLEFRFIFSSYSAKLGSFIIPNTKILYPTTTDTYLIGRNIRLKYALDALQINRDMDINPAGGKLEIIYDYEFNKFNSEGEYVIEDGLLKPQYNNFNFHKFELDASYGFALGKRHTLTARIKAGSILGPAVPDFFDFYLGGLVGIKAYPFYSISGNEVAWLNLTYRFPLFRNIDAKFGHLYLDKIFFSVYTDFGNAWTGNMPSFNEFKKGAGAEMRFQLNSYYLFPTSIFINASYGFDKFERTAREQTVSYGKEWRYYGGVLFGFDI